LTNIVSKPEPITSSSTPLRYPGGKQKLATFLVEVLRANQLTGSDYFEAYAGGAGVAVHLLLNGYVSRVHLNDSCRGVYCFWRSILDNTEDFCRLVDTVPLTVTEWKRRREIFKRREELDTFEVGFSFFYLNRCNHSGILSGGLIGGLKQESTWKIGARFPRRELIRRIESVASLRDRFDVKCWDAEDFILKYVSQSPNRGLVYCDPPYYRKGARLYLNHYKPQDHVRIAGIIQNHIKHPWILSYDNVPRIRKLYSGRRSFPYDLQYNAAKAYLGKEVLAFSDDLQIPSSSALKTIDRALSRNRSRLIQRVNPNMRNK
jgi:DNA adenine methylase